MYGIYGIYARTYTHTARESTLYKNSTGTALYTTLYTMMEVIEVGGGGRDEIGEEREGDIYIHRHRGRGTSVVVAYSSISLCHTLLSIYYNERRGSSCFLAPIRSLSHKHTAPDVGSNATLPVRRARAVFRSQRNTQSSPIITTTTARAQHRNNSHTHTQIHSQ